ncbi:hemolysin family protein [Adhaeribacter radiodurans]|uniref:HlyC/CorC family transporter n=1 Tax=Adhaeribacter radiodurans TaxID=2745197 RepID=A0A7L7LEG7_9BACT|nr:hemolysin family protein [Adhaeribacter radiodurans]QMU31163.1 HlyC/CorC family transporter [Adhaeribacter radiodurans]
MEQMPAILLIILSLLLCGLFSGIEIAYLTASRLQLELQEKRNSVSGRIIAHFLKRPSKLTATLLIGQTLALVLFGATLAFMLHQSLEPYWPVFPFSKILLVLVEVLVAALVALLMAEFLPRSLFLINANQMLQVFALPMLVLYYGLYPIVFVIISITRFIVVKLLKLEFSDQQPVFGLTDVEYYIKKQLYQPEEQSTTPEVNTKIFHNALEFRNTKVKECMVHRTEIEAVGITDSIADLKRAFVETGHSKILVYNQTIDNIIGYCHQLALFKKPADIASILTPIIIVPESMLASELFIKFVADHRSMALVVDEFGGTSGIVTVEDLIEEIFGEINDEYDLETEALLEQYLPDENSYLFSARHEIDYLNDKYTLKLPEGDYETLGGFILSVHEDIPEPNEVIAVAPYVVTILSMDDNRINTVKLTLPISSDLVTSADDTVS